MNVLVLIAGLSIVGYALRRISSLRGFQGN